MLRSVSTTSRIARVAALAHDARAELESQPAAAAEYEAEAAAAAARARVCDSNTDRVHGIHGCCHGAEGAPEGEEGAEAEDDGEDEVEEAEEEGDADRERLLLLPCVGVASLLRRPGLRSARAAPSSLRTASFPKGFGVMVVLETAAV